MIGAAYIRVSTDEQIEFSPESQKQMILRYAAAHAIELPPAYIYQDQGLSGRRADTRPAFLQMIRDASTTPPPFSVVLVWKFSRFARSRQDSILYKTLLKKRGIKVISVSEELGDDPTSLLLEALLEAMDEYYSLNLAEEVKRGMEQKFREGGVVSRPPFGYRMEDGNFVPDGERAEAVKLLFRYASEGMTLRTMADRLAEQRIFRRDGGMLTPRAIRYILQNPIYCGNAGRHLRGEWVVLFAHHPPLVSREEFEAVADRLQSGVQSKPSAPNAREWRLRGIVRCSACGRVLARAGKGCLQCTGYAKGLCTRSHWIREDRLNDLVADGIAQDIGDSVLLQGIVPSSEENRRLEETLERGERAYLAGVLPLSEYAKLREQIAAERVRLEEGAQSRRMPILLTAERIAALLRSDALSEAVAGQLLRGLLDRVIYNSFDHTICLIYRQETAKIGADFGEL